MEVNTPDRPCLTEGGLSVDDRGQVAFVNGFRFEGIRRFYMVSNHRLGFVRAWHAHRHEAKYVTVVSGAAIVGVALVDNWENPNPAAEVHRYVLSEQKPAVLYIPAGYANGFASLSEGTRLMFFSTSTVEESRSDDVRYAARHWDIWQVTER